MAEDWDLYAVVRSCKSTTTMSSTASAAAAASSSSSVVAATLPLTGGRTMSSEDTLSCLASLTFEEENDPFSFPDMVEPRNNAFQELQEFYKPFFSNNPTTTTTTTTTITGTSSAHEGIISNSSISDFGGSSGQQHQYQQQHFGPPNDTVGPQFSPQAYGHGGGLLKRQQLHEQHQNNQLLLKPADHQGQTSPTLPNLPPLPLPTIPISPIPRSRKRKNQQKKMVCHVSAENLSTDLWAWRKYGQKPIKGSPYPRNYYRCSSSKGCAARKQVERSNTEPDTFIVTYTGDHTHPRPTHRNSLAGSTRNKLSPATSAAAMKNKESSERDQQSPPPSLSPTTPLTVAQTEEKGGDGVEKQSEDTTVMEEEMDGDENIELDEDDDILIPNMGLSDDDFFLGLKELGCSPPGAAC